LVDAYVALPLSDDEVLRRVGAKRTRKVKAKR
jgi:hypothetical protein